MSFTAAVDLKKEMPRPTLRVGRGDTPTSFPDDSRKTTEEGRWCFPNCTALVGRALRG